MCLFNIIAKYSQEILTCSVIIHIFLQQMAKLSYKKCPAVEHSPWSCYSILTAQTLNQLGLGAILKNSASHDWLMHFQISLIHPWELYSNSVLEQHYH